MSVTETGAAVRIQRRRAGGWRMPEDAVYVGRPTIWGSPFKLRDRVTGLIRCPGALSGQPWEYEGRISGDGNRHDYYHPDGRITVCNVRYALPDEIVELYRRALFREDDPAIRAAWGRRSPLEVTVSDVRRELVGKSLVCWCPIGQPCHADVLLAVANGELS